MNYELFNSVSYWCSNNFNDITICKGDVNMEKDLKATIALFIKWAKEKDVKDSFVNYIYWKDNIYLKRRELKNIKNL